MASMHALRLEWLPDRYAICRLEPHAPLPGWLVQRLHEPLAEDRGGFISVTRTDRELSIIVQEHAAPLNITAARGFVALRVEGTLEFSLVGILSSLTGTLAAAKIPVFAISTYDTDMLLIQHTDAGAAAKALRAVADVDDPPATL